MLRRDYGQRCYFTDINREVSARLAEQQFLPASALEEVEASEDDASFKLWISGTSMPRF
jgi:hypothetical protein